MNGKIITESITLKNTFSIRDNKLQCMKMNEKKKKC